MKIHLIYGENRGYNQNIPYNIPYNLFKSVCLCIFIIFSG